MSTSRFTYIAVAIIPFAWLLLSTTPPDGEGVPRVRESDLTPERFLEEFVLKNKPVVITHSEQHKRANPTFTIDQLADEYGDEAVKLSLSRVEVFERVEPTDHGWSAVTEFWETWTGNSAQRDLPHDVAGIRGRMSKLHPCRDGRSRDEPVDQASEDCALFTLDRVVVRPAEKQSTIRDVLRMAGSSAEHGDAMHAYVEYEEIPERVRKGMSWWDPVFAAPLRRRSKEPEFFGFWLGVNSTKAHLHYDAQENVFMQLVGTRTWTLFPPSEGNKLYESYMMEVMEDTQNQELDTNINFSFFTSPVELDKPDLERFPNMADLKPIVVTIHPGEMLFLPSYWWHQVETAPELSNDQTGALTVAVNRWYDPAFKKPMPCGSCDLRLRSRYT